MKKQTKQDIQTLLKAGQIAITAAARLANDGQPAPKDVAELMAAWGTIAKVINHPRADSHKAFTTAQLDMLSGLMGEAA